MIAPKTKISIILLGFAALFLLATVFGVLPLLRDIKKHSEQLTLEKATLTLQKAQISSLQDFKDNLSSYQQTLDKIKEGFIDASAPVAFMEFIEDQAKKAGLQIAVFPVGAVATQQGPWPSNGFNVAVAGSYGSCLRFLEILENSHWLTEISQVNIDRISQESRISRDFEGLQEGNAVFSVILRAFSNSASSTQTQ